MADAAPVVATVTAGQYRRELRTWFAALALPRPAVGTAVREWEQRLPLPASVLAPPPPTAAQAAALAVSAAALEGGSDGGRDRATASNTSKHDTEAQGQTAGAAAEPDSGGGGGGTEDVAPAADDANTSASTVAAAAQQAQQAQQQEQLYAHLPLPPTLSAWAALRDVEPAQFAARMSMLRAQSLLVLSSNDASVARRFVGALPCVDAARRLLLPPPGVARPRATLELVRAVLQKAAPTAADALEVARMHMV